MHKPAGPGNANSKIRGTPRRIPARRAHPAYFERNECEYDLDHIQTVSGFPARQIRDRLQIRCRCKKELLRGRSFFRFPEKRCPERQCKLLQSAGQKRGRKKISLQNHAEGRCKKDGVYGKKSGGENPGAEESLHPGHRRQGL